MDWNNYNLSYIKFTCYKFCQLPCNVYLLPLRLLRKRKNYGNKINVVTGFIQSFIKKNDRLSDSTFTDVHNRGNSGEHFKASDHIHLSNGIAQDWTILIQHGTAKNI